MKLTRVPFTNVAITNGFWKKRIEVNREVTLAREYELCDETGRLAAWDLTWQPGQPNPPHVFWDSDVAKWIEAASYSVAAAPDPELESKLDRLIAKIDSAQSADGYLNSHFLVYEKHGLGRRFTNLRDEHELYCAGHLIEAAVAHFRATGKRTLLGALCRYADYIDSVFGPEPGKRRGYCGHEEIELALVKLYETTGERRYLKLAKYFVDERGRQPHYFDLEAQARNTDPRSYRFGGYDYMQAHQPVREQTVVTGHAVRAMYLYSAMADLAGDDDSLLVACERLWRSVCDERMYLTGGIGPSAGNEGFTIAYDLPDETAYAETCAAVGMVFWNERMLRLTGGGKYADVMERALYNGTISGVSLDGQKFFYDNPLASRGAHHRQGWFDCACCPPNLARLIASIGGYFYSTDDDGLWVHLYAGNEARLRVGEVPVAVRQVTGYPWDEAIELTLSLDQPKSFALNLRIPGWCESFSISVNGNPINDLTLQQGYARLTREWRAGDAVSVRLAMPVQFVRANPAVRQLAGRVALQRGPIVYCLESADNPIAPLDRIALPGDHADFKIEPRPDLLDGVTVLRGNALVLDDEGWSGKLYGPKADTYSPVEIVAVPYFAWDNREPGEMRVWLRSLATTHRFLLER